MGQTATVGFRLPGQRQDNLLAVASTLALEEFAVNVLAEVLVKGGDYHLDSLAETTVVKAYDRRALAIALVEGYSTTALVRRIRGLVAESGFVLLLVGLAGNRLAATPFSLAIAKEK